MSFWFVLHSYTIDVVGFFGKSTTSDHDAGPLVPHMTLFVYTIVFIHYPGVCRMNMKPL